jgi:hypothetical protein
MVATRHKKKQEDEEKLKTDKEVEEEMKIEPPKPQKRKFEENKFSAHEKSLKDSRKKGTGPTKTPPALPESVDLGLGVGVVVIADLNAEEAAKTPVAVGRPKQNLHRLPTFGGGSSRVPRNAKGVGSTYGDKA